MVYDRMIVCRGLLEFWPHQGRLPGSCELSEILIRSWSLVRHPVTARAKWKSFCAQQMWPRKTPVRMVVAAQRNGKNPRTGGKTRRPIICWSWPWHERVYTMMRWCLTYFRMLKPFESDSGLNSSNLLQAELLQTLAKPREASPVPDQHKFLTVHGFSKWQWLAMHDTHMAIPKEIGAGVWVAMLIRFLLVECLRWHVVFLQFPTA